MTVSSVVLIGFHDQGNLGIGYLASTLTSQGYRVEVLDFRQGEEAILSRIATTQPLLIGFSLIFQFFLSRFARLASYLRRHGVECLFCVGGHFPTLRHEQVLDAVPELDFVVRCEGEVTLVELVERLARGRDWRDVAGIAYRGDTGVVKTPPRPLITDLDTLPHPARPLESLAVLGKRTSPLLASRGCSRDCSFCSIRQFYHQSPGKLVRVRRPASVVEEMKGLYEEHGVSIFLFQDDDFPVGGRFGQRWIGQFVEALRAEGLYGRILWKISCRADEVTPALFAELRKAGLYLVYLGLESGTAAGLEVLNKRLGVEDNLRAVETLQALDLGLAFGFMLFEPASTFDSILANVGFLRHIVGDGRTPAVFGRMLPYAGTPIEHALTREGRLRGNMENPDYAFLDPRLDAYFSIVNDLTHDWIHGSDAVATRLTWAWQEYWVLQRLFPPLDGLPAYEGVLRSCTKASNACLLDAVEESCRIFATGRRTVSPIAKRLKAGHRFSDKILAARDAFILRNQDTLLAALETARSAPTEVCAMP